MKRQTTTLKKKTNKQQKKTRKKPARKWYSISKPMEYVVYVFVCVLLLLWLGMDLYQPVISVSIQSPFGSNDELAISKETHKHLEMLNVIVHIEEIASTGSGVLLCKRSTDQYGVFEYFVVTNHHVVMNRKVPILESVDGLRGHLGFDLQDPGCKVTVFSNNATKQVIYDANVIVESPEDDLAIIRFITTDDIANIAKTATVDMMTNVGLFDEVYAVGCQFGWRPIPTRGIISGLYYGKQLIGFSHTAQIGPGSSGGGLFKQDGEHFYLIGMPRMVVSYGSQIIPHYAYSVSTNVLRYFLCANDMGFIIDDKCKVVAENKKNIEHEVVEERQEPE